ncbi:MAG TPA: methylmalonyl-CoA epimerase [Candidatus Acidoferrum sp.]|nr:methylmalonyl-CoA epimerase [Candidatus Acidoferrum sp.]
MIAGIHHVAIAVRDLESALAFYRDTLGLGVGERADVADQGVHAALLPREEGEIELLEPTSPAGGVARFLERRGEGPHHLCLETSDVAAALAQAKAADLPLIDQIPRPGLAGLIGFLHPKACCGLLVELAQRQGHAERPGPQPGGVRAVGIDTVYVVAKEIEAAGATLARNFGGRLTPARDDTRLEARGVTVWLGKSRITVLGPGDSSGPSDVTRFLADRGEGLYGLGLCVKDFRGALRHLASAGISVKVTGTETTPLACLEASRTHGVNLFLCPDAPTAKSCQEPQRGETKP